jgi:phosphomannomutase
MIQFCEFVYGNMFKKKTQMTTTKELDFKTAANINLWLNGQYDDKTKEEVRRLVKENPKEATDAFYTNLSFGTGGMRGLMGVGSNRMNDYTVRAATQGLANYVNKQRTALKGHSAFIGYDSRHHSHSFAKEAARVLAGNGIKVYLCKDIRPTPLVSFGCRFKECITAIMITASHNPPEYNGYKVYWRDGGQVLPPHDLGIVEEAAKITDPAMVKMTPSINHPLIEIVSEEIDNPYIIEGSKLQNYSEKNRQHGNNLKIVYTSLHGTGITLAPKMLAEWGFSKLIYVDQQIIPDGNFPTVKYPNPEERSALALGIDVLKATESDLLIATDPDADRVGVAVKDNNKIVLLTGNQIAALCLEHVCEALTSQKKMPEKAAFIKTIVTTELFKAICNHYKKDCFNVLTGFKYIAELIHEWENDPKGYEYIFGGEESYGYLFGTITRDKDAIISSALICEMALHAKLQGKTLIDLLHDLYHKYGAYIEKLVSVSFEESKAGKDKMSQSMEQLRKNHPEKINEIAVVAVEDYLFSLRTDITTKKTEKITLPKSDVLLFWLKDGSKLIVRPSGTEPKIKLYCGVSEPLSSSLEQTLHNLENKSSELLQSLNKLLN